MRVPDLVAIYADESCLGNGRGDGAPGGAAGVVEWRHPGSGRVHRKDYWVSEPSTTNNRMALRSVIEGFRGLSARGDGRRFRVIFTTDSRYIVDGMTSWVHAWEARGWRRKGGTIENLELWREALRALGPHECEWRWVRGHRGHPQNEYANHLAVQAAATQTSSGGFVASGFEAWIAEHSGAAIASQGVAPFPAGDDFRGRHRRWTI